MKPTTLLAYMNAVKVRAAKEGVSTYGATTKHIKTAHAAGTSVDDCVTMLVNRQKYISDCYGLYKKAAAGSCYDPDETRDAEGRMQPPR